MSKYHINHNGLSWTCDQDYGLGRLRYKDLLTKERCGCEEFLFGYAELDPGEILPLHAHAQVQCDYILSGNVWVRLGKRRVELGSESATYFPSGVPHLYEVIGREPLKFVYAYACEKVGAKIDTRIVSDDQAHAIDRPNMSHTRWAVADSFEPWIFWEPSKGSKGMTWKSLFSREKGGLEEMDYGTCYLPAGGRYSLHYHEQPEIFYCISGKGVFYVGDEKISAAPGSAIYIPKNTVHGADNRSTQSLCLIWIYGTEVANGRWNWTPVEDIRLDAS